VIDDTLRTAEIWRSRGDDVAIATVVRTQRSAPRPLGTKLAVSSRGDMAGSVSGGCVEGAVYEEAVDVLKGGDARLVHYGIVDDVAWDVGLACGGEIWIWVDRFTGWPRPAERSARVTVVEGPHAGGHLLVTAEGAGDGDIDASLVDAAVAAGQEAMAAERNATVPADDHLLFAEALVPQPRIVVVGAVDTAESLCGMAHLIGWRTAVVDPRGKFATAERIPSADEIVVAWPEEGYEALGLVPQDHVVVLTHDPKLDDPAIAGALARHVGFVGALGSRRTQEKRRARLLERGIAEADIDRIAGPVGLDIGGHTPEETALSILGEVIAFRADRPGGRLTHAKGRIHAVDASV
jgi:xanthine dehydrogenase accessory factor